MAPRHALRNAPAFLATALVSAALWIPAGASTPGGSEAAFGPLAGPAAVLDEPACTPVDRMPVSGRASPYDSVHVTLAGGIIKICYGSPALRGRTMLGGGEVPFGQLWRFGANEPTTLHTSVPLSVGGVRFPPGSVTLYAIPGADEWEIFISRSTTHWGLRITPEVRAQEIGSFRVVPEVLDEPVESMTFRFEDPGTRSAALVMEWQTTRLAIPVTVTGG
ncbi:MAG: DUF2911 domain-containing protein [Gemmatimonadales bacterium]|nr:MAG: DUF2911 domain-containing protein [Gemmatimonadales bacterium]